MWVYVEICNSKFAMSTNVLYWHTMARVSSWSKEKMNAYLLARYYAQRKLFISMLGDKCSKCGTTIDLEIDHIDPTKKSFAVGRLWAEKKLPEALEELKKCQLLCHLHHQEKSREDLRQAANRRYVIQNGKDGFRHGTLYGFINKKCKCAICLKAQREFYDMRNKKRRVGPGYGPRVVVVPVVGFEPTESRS